MPEAKRRIYIGFNKIDEGFRGPHGGKIFRPLVLKDDQYTKRHELGSILQPGTKNYAGARMEALIHPPNLESRLKQFEALDYDIEEAVWKRLQAALGIIS